MFVENYVYDNRYNGSNVGFAYYLDKDNDEPASLENRTSY